MGDFFNKKFAGGGKFYIYLPPDNQKLKNE